MAKFELSDAVELFSEQSNNITSLWTVYVVATFAAAGYSITVKDNTTVPELWVISAVTVGFWGFALGHLRLLRQALSLNLKLSHDIANFLSPSKDDGENLFRSSLSLLSKSANPLWPSICTHIIIDFCVTVTLWAPVLRPATKSAGVG